jgi:uncharacterized protein (TIGR02145 family)
MAENLNYQVGMTFNQQSNQAHGQPITNVDNGVPAIGSYWCPGVSGATLSADKNTCNVYGALYTWETAVSPDGKGTWDESVWSSKYQPTGAPVSGGANVRGICPTGWHLPSDYEWAVMLDAVDDAATTYVLFTGSGFLGENAGIKLRSASTYAGTDPGDGRWQTHTAYNGIDSYGFNVLASGHRDWTGDNFMQRGTTAFGWASTVGHAQYAYSIYFRLGEPGASRVLFRRSRSYNVRCTQD